MTLGIARTWFSHKHSRGNVLRSGPPGRRGGSKNLKKKMVGTGTIDTKYALNRININ